MKLAGSQANRKTRLPEMQLRSLSMSSLKRAVLLVGILQPLQMQLRSLSLPSLKLTVLLVGIPLQMQLRPLSLSSLLTLTVAAKFVL